MKRSTKLLIVLLIVVLVAPIIYISVVVSKLPSLKEWITETIETLDANEAYLYEYKMAVFSSQQLPDCYLSVTTYSGAVDTLHSVNFVAPAEGVRAELIGDSIVINIDEVQAVANDKLLLTVELPAGSTLKVYNQQPSLDIHFDHVDMGAVNVATYSDLLFDNAEMGALMTLESDSKRSVSLKSSDIGVVKINGNNTTLAVSHSNVGAMSVAGTCDAITLDDSNIGVMSWNDECNKKAVVNDCAITVKVKENIVNVTWNEEEEDSDSLVKMYIIDEDGEKVDVSLDGVHVKSSDGERVDISPAGVHVEDGETTVKITPTGVVVKENGEDIVNIGLNGVTVKE